MADERQTGCGRIFLGSVLGVILGIAAGFLIGVLDAPPDDPTDGAIYEGYTPFVLLVVMPLGLIVGGILGAVAGGHSRGAGGRAFLAACAGWLAGLGAGKLVPMDPLFEARHLLLHLVLTAGMTGFGLFLALRNSARHHEARG